MRRILGVIAAVFFLSIMGSVPEARAAALGFTGTLAVQFATLDPVSISGSGTALVNGSSSGGHLTSLDLPSSPFATTGYVLDISDPGVFPIFGIKVTAHNGAGAFS